ncbi:MAG: ATP-binding cassette domain-containing protein [Chloroflexus sp.]|jgi:ABC-type nitrate/sulfonate/bicarbonate transport system, ATPase component|nr:ATP-binding cassette domain-containing protein [Chloroflexus sp.]MBO9315404.1 ATP-binding cassette domain-containing protein [Chloroflexus sp.]MBO9318768.1 ATP-binding cassette domain-containing protein [Chloroflexus sp.]MBO9374374.1 ATP-binding cassette domain-containing protein [Chloroflexus sp.]
MFLTVDKPVDNLSAEASAQPAIRVQSVTKRYHTRTGEVQVLAGIDVSVAVGEVVALVGPSGCGKSTLLRIVSGLEQADTGEVKLLGLSPLKARRERRFGIAFQSAALLEWRDTAANIALPLELAGWTPADRDRRVAELLARVGLSDAAERLPRQLSGGMQQRVALARALALAPPVLLLDEPFSALDELTREQLQGELLDLLSTIEPKPAVLMVTHNLAEAVLLADRVIVLSRRPARVLAEVTINLPRPRHAELRDDERLHLLVAELRRVLRRDQSDGQAAMVVEI